MKSTEVGFLNKCKEWQDRSRNATFIGDVYDGNVWKDTKEIDG